MKRLIYILILLALPMSLSWGQTGKDYTLLYPYYCDCLDALKKWDQRYNALQHRADSLEKFIRQFYHCELYIDSTIHWNIGDLKDSLTALNKRLNECEDEDVNGAIWLQKPYWNIYEPDTQVYPDFNRDGKVDDSTKNDYVLVDSICWSNPYETKSHYPMPGMRVDSVYLNGNAPCPDNMYGCLVLHYGWRVDTVNLWQGYWRIDTTWEYYNIYEWDWANDDGYTIRRRAHIDVIDTTWRPIVPIEEGRE